jgi:Fur family ferric uptake transcriptional regulator
MATLISTKELLKKHSLSITDGRRKILDLFLKSTGALAHADIEKKLKDSFDRVTIYRTLQSFTEKGIIHTIPSADNSVKYALCKDECAEGHHQDDHVHFICDQCGNTYCIDHISVPTVSLPKGFKISNSNLVISGVCNKC